MKRGQALVAALISVLAFGIRCLPYHEVFVKGRVFFLEADSYYHLRRILYTMRYFPESLGFDPYLGYPTAAKAIWPTFLDSAIALVLLPFAKPEDAIRVESLVVWIPPLAGAATVLTLFLLARRLFGFGVAVVSSLTLCFLSAHFWYSQIGFVDHHAIISLLSSVLLAATVASLAHARDRSWSPRRAIGSGVALGLLSTVILLVWPGGILYVAMAAGGLLIFALNDSQGDMRERLLPLLVAFHATALGALLPFSLFNSWPQWSAFSPVVLSRFQPLFFFIAAIHALACHLLLGRSAGPTGVGRRYLEAGASGLALLVLAAMVFPEILGSAGDAVSWLARTDSFQAMVAESRPLFDLHGQFNHHIAELRLSYFVYLLPFATLALAWQHRKREDFVEVHFVAGWTLILFAFTLMQKRFFNTSSVALALVFGWSVVALWHWISRSLAPDLRGGIVAGGLTGLLALGVLWPTFAAYEVPLASVRARIAGRPPIYDQRLRMHLVRQNVAEWIRHNTPKTSGLWRADASPEYGVLARWGEGHFIQYVARRPTIVGNFGDDLGVDHFLKARSVYLAQPQAAAKVLEDLRARYIVIRIQGETRPLAKWLIDGDGSGSGHYRLVYEAPSPLERRTLAYKVFEFVPGAEVEGRAAPGMRVHARLAFETNLGRTARYETSTVANDQGIYRLHLAYASRGAPPATRPAAEYELWAGEAKARLAVDEDRVLGGETLQGPGF